MKGTCLKNIFFNLLSFTVIWALKILGSWTNIKHDGGHAALLRSSPLAGLFSLFSVASEVL